VAIVADASPLILFARAGHVQVLVDLFGEVVVPSRVVAEAYRDEPSRYGAAALASAGAWLRIEEPTDQQEVAVLTAAVDAGEAEASR
jgi:predicted nucleic acid-binding protein